MVTAAIAGILPALHATRRRSGEDLRQLGGSTGIRLGRMWNALIVVQIAFAVAVLPAAIKIGLNETRTSLTQPNYPAEEFVGFAVATGDEANPLGHRLLELKRRLQAEPRVAGVTFTAHLPPRERGRIEVEGVPMAGVHEKRVTSRDDFRHRNRYLESRPRVVGWTAFRPRAIRAQARDRAATLSAFSDAVRGWAGHIRYAEAAEDEPSLDESSAWPNLQRNPIAPAVSPPLLYPSRTAGVRHRVAVRLRGLGVPDGLRLSPEAAPDPRRDDSCSDERDSRPCNG